MVEWLLLVLFYFFNTGMYISPKLESNKLNQRNDNKNKI